MTLDDKTIISVAVIGGTGKEGTGLAMRWALNGYRVIIGSRDAARAASHAHDLNQRLGADVITGMANPEAARQANVIVLTVPYSAHHDTLETIREHLDGKVLVDITVPLMPPKVRRVYIPEGKSAALEAQAQLGNGVRIVSAFQNVSADKVEDPNMIIECDVIVTGDDDAAKDEVSQLVSAAGMRAVDGGPLENSVAAEALTPVLLYINKKYGIKGAGIRITGM